jgi:LysM repeat protein
MHKRGWVGAVVGVLVAAFAGRDAGGQTLKGSHASVELMYDRARSSDLPFFSTPQQVYEAAMSGQLKTVSLTDDVTIERTLFPFVLPRTLDFINAIGARYRAACGERIVVTSGTRPIDKQPRNASPESVHPTGMAVDFRKPTGTCLTWLRAALIELESTHVIEATEERHPPHFHVAVLDRSAAQYAAAIKPSTSTVSTGEVALAVPPVPVAPPPTVAPTAPSPQPRAPVATDSAERSDPPTKPTDAGDDESYRVRQGDTLWGIARQHNTTVARLRAANNLGSGAAIRPGQLLKLP